MSLYDVATDDDEFGGEEPKGIVLPAAGDKGYNIQERHFTGGAIFLMAVLIFTFYFIAIPVANLKFTHGYTRFATPPSPNVFRSDRYTWGWVMIYLVAAANLILIYLFAAAMVNYTISEIAFVHLQVSRLTALTSVATFVALSISWLFFCNRYFSRFSYCHDPRHCCVFFGASLDNSEWCPNTTPCVPNVGSGDLTRSDDFFQVWLFSLLFSFWGLFSTSINAQMTRYGLWQEEYNVDEE